VETAVKIARAATGRPAVLVFEGAYHGRTNLTLAMTSRYAAFKRGFGPFAPEVYRLPFPDLYRRPPHLSDEDVVEEAIAGLERALVAQVDPAALAAVVIEPVQGEAGFVPAPPAFLRALRDLHAPRRRAGRRRGAVGMGRTGRLWAVEHAGVVPDLLVTAKSLGAGMPIAAVVGRADVMDGPHPGGLGGTYSGNPLACVAALAAIDAITAPGFLERARAVGARLRGPPRRPRRPPRPRSARCAGSGRCWRSSWCTTARSGPAPELVQRITAAALARADRAARRACTATACGCCRRSTSDDAHRRGHGGARRRRFARDGRHAGRRAGGRRRCA
jgi:4-aminobutyrate aminotransferase-like enzyme